jgi:hypothetical protein
MMPLPNPTLGNDFNQLLNDRRNALAGAMRFAMAPDCNPIDPAKIDLTPAQSRNQLIEVPVNATNAGDNFLIQTRAGRKLIYEILLWNGSGAPIDWALFQGPSSLNNVKLFMPGVPAGFGLLLGFNGNWEMPHFQIDQGQPLVLTLNIGGLITGLLRYKVENGTG